MKKFLLKKISLLLIVILSFGIAGCGKKDEPISENIENDVQDTTPLDAAAVSDAFALHAAFSQANNVPEVTAQTAILVEPSSGTILFEKGAKEKMYPASTTKMITALVTMDYFKEDELITIGSEINEVSLDSSKAGHIVGETITIKNLIRGLIIPSGNDTANVLAAAVAKRVQSNDNLTFAESQKIFAELMNKRAKELGAVNTHFTNAHGYHDENHYSCAYDMALFACAYLENSTLKEIANEKSFAGNGADNMFQQSEGMKTQNYAWRSHNLLITDNEYNYSYASGIKTGFTNEAGDCVAAAAEKDGETLVAIIFNSPDPGRWLDGKNLFEFGFNEYERAELGKTAEVLESMPLTKHNRLEGDTLDVVFNQDVVTYLPTGTSDGVEKTIVYDEKYLDVNKDGVSKLKAPIAKGEKIGTATFQIDSKTVLSEDVYAGREVTKGTILSSIKYFFKNFTSIVFSKKGLMGLAGFIVVIVLIFIIFRIVSNRRKRYSRGYTFQKHSSRKGGRRRRRF
ncbi:D-alanyl-D-alanine carboxypeptidase DacA precursor [Anaerotignum neopropionicum]|uniref:serine-type D-Ala-D-Ala carboxypeptidase n=1 Tax=Anaerotignum neopropionicum TaxID=36847 RepID=A0A136WFF9_9FIRM|nr:D-alanyl-D-alanine carboxypeptidase family protein [Anaerotignum neopropionicum]KXL53180.1 D-alanyl-D-alanine carboxypeptidase DacA precursor [Anaerotignum neopropionicum]